MMTITLSVLAATIICSMMVSVDGFDHIVGGSLGWSIPPNDTFYDEWAASPRIFGLGDKLVFPYRPGQYNIIEVNKQEFDDCTKNKPLSMYANGPTTYLLATLGDYYFYSGIAKHCELGLKLHIKVTTNTSGFSGDNFHFDFAPDEAHAPVPVPGNLTNHPPSSSASFTNIGLASVVFAALLSLHYHAWKHVHPIAYIWVHLRAVVSNVLLSVLYI